MGVCVNHVQLHMYIVFIPPSLCMACSEGKLSWWVVVLGILVFADSWLTKIVSRDYTLLL